MIFRDDEEITKDMPWANGHPNGPAPTGTNTPNTHHYTHTTTPNGTH